jgi:hypothetical protein
MLEFGSSPKGIPQPSEAFGKVPIECIVYTLIQWGVGPHAKNYLTFMV